MSLQIKFYQVGCGDAISIRFLGSDKQFHNILVDGGHKKEFRDSFKQEIERITTDGETLDLWIITHIDSDHIGGILEFIEGNHKRLQGRLVLSNTTFWYNHTENLDRELDLDDSGLISVSQGIKLREYLKANSKLEEAKTNACLTPINLFGANVTILSPSQAKYEAMIEHWEEEENTDLISGSVFDYDKKIEDFDLTKFTEDTAIPNGSSIAFLFEYDCQGNDIKVLFLADSHPSVIVEALKRLGYNTTDNKLKLDYMQVSHHGSKHNTSDEILEMIDCSNFVVSANGMNEYNLPHKETLVRIIRKNIDANISICITCENRKTNSIFDIDSDLNNVECKFPEYNQNFININF